MSSGTQDSLLSAALEVYWDNPGLALAAPIFDTLVRAQAETAVDAGALRMQMLEDLRTFEAQAIGRGLSHNHTRLILYALAATADDCILHTAWGRESDWSSKTLISALFQETWGGERFFALLQQMMAGPHAVVREIEFFYYCLLFGFEGKYRLASNGSRELVRLKEEIYQFLRSVKGGVKREMAPSWRGLSAEGSGPRDMRLLLIGAAAGCFVLVLAFSAYYVILRREAALAAAQVQNLTAEPILAPRPPPPPPPEPVRVVPQATRPAAEPVKPQQTPFQAISAFLEPEQKAGQLAVLDQNGNVVIRTTMELFASASTTLRPPYDQVTRKVGEALAKYPGPVKVFGYTDNLPIRTATFPNNLVLSAARASAVAKILEDVMGTKGRVTAEGRGDADPIADNATPEGRQQNRRVEIVLTPQ
ncbi:type VI secretion system protein TssL, long form [Aquabacter spiritensis]|uniref:Type VI secretion system protein ImpK n=1 Tax=Aquabacter spiritensis TaxID=933073 RepID=A0A4R3LRT0_9HYPH|nr:type VI secretion system protein TssL, long form [Aquabacter spiritensis]TCT02466.1 type VI secretion system protein ImpK [Aquabacter spiritensis]